jgi:hypothetical protein
MALLGAFKINGIPIVGPHMTTGQIYFVDSGTGLSSNTGLSEKAPLATLFGTGGAISKTTANQGDVIYLFPGHAETITTSGALSTAGVTVVGLGNGDNRPTITVNAAVYGLNFTADDIKVHNVRVVAGSSATAATRLVRVAASDIEVSKCRFEMAYDMYHLGVNISGDNIKYLDCEFENTVSTSASDHPQTALLTTLATNVLVKGCRFRDVAAKKAERWRACVEGGGLASSTCVEECTFICRGIATRTRSAGASDGTGTQSPTMATLYCRAISPSANTSAGALYTPTYQYIIESYDVAAINKVGLVSVTTSDKRMKTEIVYL